MNRQQRRAASRQGPTPKPAATVEDAKRLIDEAFTDRISWTAARVLLVRVTNDVGWHVLAPDLRASIATFLERHPEPIGRG
jgi:hypothetical protein